MGKGFQNFMSKKTFHPGSYKNQKRIQEAEEAAEAKRKHDQETLAQYIKEQELFQQQSLVSRESKDKLSLNFMYSAPPGTSNSKKDEETQEDDDIMLRTSIKWSKEIKQEFKRKSSGPQAIGNYDDDNDEPRIVLKWKRTEPKSKNRKHVAETQPPPTQPLDSAVKLEKSETRVATKLESASSSDIKRIKKERWH